MPDTRLILHVKGTEQETTVLPKQAVRTAISQGQITHSQLIWSVADNAWKQVRELPHLLPSQKLAPAPARVPTGALPKVAAAPVTPTPKVATGPVPRIAQPATGTPTAKNAGPTVKAARTPAVKVGAPTEKTEKSFVVKEENPGVHPLKWFCIFLGIVIFALVAVNYFLVDRSVVSGLAQTPYSQVTAYAHLGAYVQPNVIVIHVPASSQLTKANLTDFLVSLAHSTPGTPFGGNPYSRVALTSGWTASYTLRGIDWKQLGDMASEDEAQRKDFLLSVLTDPIGEPLMTPQGNKSEAAMQAEREKIWDTFAAQFCR